MYGTTVAVRRGARPAQDDDRSLLEGLLGEPTPPAVAAPPWASPARLRPVRCRPEPAWPTARPLRRGRPLAAAAALLLAGGLVAAGAGAGTARAAAPHAPAAQVASPAARAAGAPAPAGAAGALAALRVAPAADETLLARLLAEPAPAAADEALLAELLAAEPPALAAAAPPAAVSFATVAALPAAAFNYAPVVQQLPMITLADNVAPPAPAVTVAAQQQPPPPPGYEAPPGYRDGQYLGGQYPGLAPGQFPASGAPAATRPATSGTSTARPATSGTTTTRPAVYTVRAGDTLSAIALRFYGDARYAARIWEANYGVIGGNPNAIFPGQRLTLPGVAAQPTTSPAAALPARGPIPVPSRYTIQPRDFLRWISQRAYGNEMLWPEIYQANRNVLGPNPDLIYPGVTVYIP